MASAQTLSNSSARSPIRLIDLIVIHCSATPNGRSVTVQEIDDWHAARGFARDPGAIGYNQPALAHIGYHYVVYAHGPVVTGRGLNEPGAHAIGHNARSIGICLVGTDSYRRAQWNSLRILVTATIEETLSLAQRLRLRISGHRDLSPDIDGDGTVEPHEWLKTCPGFKVAAWLAGGMEPLAGHILDPEPAPLPRAA